MTAARHFARLIGVGILRQTDQFDNLGDGESIIFMSETVVLNLVKLAEFLLAEGVATAAPPSEEEGS